ncbi:hypothetical protein [Corynebacterium callunae]|uniref:Uncharacterized protein n=1 Tax=Corynebacterium callunae DSM 20147 TaxID=1121353 RepID=M1TPD0_9CORY|nr:hypothetical protein [Corynebacterium callunae]AGG66201.1 hypothetical protein H924_03775 [Corynebacterium callunae DSM 20147]
MKASRKARDRARKDHAEKFEQLQRQVEAQAVILDLLDEQEKLEAKFGRAVDVLRSLGVKAAEVEESTGLSSLQQSRYIKIWQETGNLEDEEPQEDSEVEEEKTTPESGTEVAQEPEETEESAVVESIAEAAEASDSFGFPPRKAVDV